MHESIHVLCAQEVRVIASSRSSAPVLVESEADAMEAAFEKALWIYHDRGEIEIKRMSDCDNCRIILREANERAWSEAYAAGFFD